MLYNSDKTNSHSFILKSLFSLIFCLYNEGSLVYFRQITTSAEAIYHAEAVTLRCLKICINFIIMLSSVKVASKKQVFHL